MEDLWEVGWLIILEGKAHGWGMLKDSNSGHPKTGNIQLFCDQMLGSILPTKNYRNYDHILMFPKIYFH